MKMLFKILAALLILSLSLCVFVSCERKEAQGSSSVMTQSETSDTMQEQNKEPGTPDKTPNTNASKPAIDKTPNSSSSPEAQAYEKGFPITKQKMTLKIMGMSLPSRGDAEMMSQFKYYEKITNIKTVYVGVEEPRYLERIALAIQSGDLPDVITARQFSDSEMIKYTLGKDKLFVEVGSYLEKWAPNIQKVLDSSTVIKGVNIAHDGKIYTLPSMRNTNTNYGHWLNIRKDWLDALDLEIPKTPEEFFDVMRAFRDRDPNGNGKKDEIAYGIYTWTADLITAWWGVQSTKGRIGIDRDRKVYYPHATENARAAVKFWHEFYEEEGLMWDKTGYMGGWNHLPGLIEQGNLGCFAYSYMSSKVYTPELLEKYIAIPFPSANFKNSEINVSKTANPFYDIPSRGNVVITKACKNVEAALRYFDYYYTADGVMLGNWGSPESGNYKKNKDGTYSITNAKLLSEDADYQNAMGWAMGIAEMSRVYPNLVIRENYVNPDANPAYEKYQKEAIKTYTKAHKENPTYYLPNLQLTAEEVAVLRKYEKANFMTSHNTIRHYVTGYKDIAEFDKIVAQWKNDGLDDYLAIYQRIVNRNKDYILDTKTYAK